MREFLIGQIRVASSENGHALCHRDDVDSPPDALASHHDPEDAAALALYDDAGAYRPLKTAPNLRRGWRLVLADDRALGLALGLFYPARMGAFRLFQEGKLAVTPLRDTLNRQTGMYRVTGKISDEQADALVGRVLPFGRRLFADDSLEARRGGRGPVRATAAGEVRPRARPERRPGTSGRGFRAAAMSGSVQPARGRGAGRGQIVYKVGMPLRGTP